MSASVVCSTYKAIHSYLVKCREKKSKSSILKHSFLFPAIREGRSSKTRTITIQFAFFYIFLSISYTKDSAFLILIRGSRERYLVCEVSREAYVSPLSSSFFFSFLRNLQIFVYWVKKKKKPSANN